MCPIPPLSRRGEPSPDPPDRRRRLRAAAGRYLRARAADLFGDPGPPRAARDGFGRASAAIDLAAIGPADAGGRGWLWLPAPVLRHRHGAEARVARAFFSTAAVAALVCGHRLWLADLVGAGASLGMAFLFAGFALRPAYRCHRLRARLAAPDGSGAPRPTPNVRRAGPARVPAPAGPVVAVSTSAGRPGLIPSSISTPIPNPNPIPVNSVDPRKVPHARARSRRPDRSAASVWPRRLRRLALLAVFLPFLALAQDQAFAPERLRPTDTDVSVRLLRAAVGSFVDRVRLADTVGAPDEGAFGGLFRAINSFLLLVLGLLVFVKAVAALLDTAHDGEALGRERSTV
ncbi:MAG: hypothetical protein V9G18_13475 [Albidovulum sp.]